MSWSSLLLPRFWRSKHRVRSGVSCLSLLFEQDVLGLNRTCLRYWCTCKECLSGLVSVLHNIKLEAITKRHYGDIRYITNKPHWWHHKRTLYQCSTPAKAWSSQKNKEKKRSRRNADQGHVGSTNTSLLGLVIPLALQGNRGVLGVKDIIPPPKADGIVTHELFMVQNMMISTSPERKEMVKTPRELVATVLINDLKLTQDNIYVHPENVQLTRHRAPKDRAANCTEAQDHHFDR